MAAKWPATSLQQSHPGQGTAKSCVRSALVKTARFFLRKTARLESPGRASAARRRQAADTLCSLREPVQLPVSAASGCRTLGNRAGYLTPGRHPEPTRQTTFGPPTRAGLPLGAGCCRTGAVRGGFVCVSLDAVSPSQLRAGALNETSVLRVSLKDRWLIGRG